MARPINEDKVKKIRTCLLEYIALWCNLIKWMCFYINNLLNYKYMKNHYWIMFIKNSKHYGFMSIHRRLTMKGLKVLTTSVYRVNGCSLVFIDCVHYVQME